MNQDSTSSKLGPAADFVQAAEAKRLAGDLTGATELLLAGLSRAPENHLARLALARIFYEQGFHPFAERELLELREKVPENESIAKLVERIAPELAGSKPVDSASQPKAATVAPPAKTVAAAEFDLDDLDEEE